MEQVDYNLLNKTENKEICRCVWTSNIVESYLYLQCDMCDRWNHLECIKWQDEKKGYEARDIQGLFDTITLKFEKFFCPDCCAKEGKDFHKQTGKKKFSELDT